MTNTLTGQWISTNGGAWVLHQSPHTTHTFWGPFTIGFAVCLIICVIILLFAAYEFARNLRF